MLLFSTQFSNLKNYFSFLLALMPVSYIAGNLVINFNLLLIIISGILIFKKDIFRLKLYMLDKSLISFFILIIITGVYNDFILYNFYNDYSVFRGIYGTTIKSILFLKYLLFYQVLRFLIEKKIIDLKLFYIFSSFASIFVCFDIFFQFKFGVDIFGFERISSNRLGGPFGDELIAGGYIQRFAIFTFFLLPLFFSKKSNQISKFLIPILFLIFILGIILSGNRMPLILFIFLITLISIFHKQIRKFFLSFIIIFSLIFTIALRTNDEIKYTFISFYNQISNIAVAVLEKDFNNDNNPQYLKEFVTFYDTWLMSKYIGGGIKNFRYYCHVRPNINKNSKFICNMHPHNYYLEILTETGLAGLFNVLLIFILLLHATLYKKYFTNSSLSQNKIIIPFIFLFIVEIFPIKSTGSFFTTGSATYLFLIIAVLVGLTRQHNLIENKN